MPKILHIKRPLQSAKDGEKVIVEDGSTLRDFMVSRGIDGGVKAFVSGVSLDKSKWGDPIESDATVVLMPDVEGDILDFLVQAPIDLFKAAFGIFDIPVTTLEDQADPVYFLSGQRNQIKLGEPIESPYGRNRLWPSYAARPYNKFENNDQLLFQLFCLGQGEYDIELQQIEDTALANFNDITTEVYPPGASVTLFPDNVVTSSEVSAIELFGPNEDDFPVGGFVGPFTANPSGTLTTILEWDVVLPRGLFKQESDGKFTVLTVTADFEYRLIDNSGSPLGSFVTVPFSKTLATNSQQRFTVSTPVASGRYEVRAKRTNNAATETSESDEMQWFQLRAQLPSTKDYGAVTLVAMKARASNNLNDQSKSRYNVIATRKLPIFDGATFSALTATRNPVWAFVDVLRSVYGGNLPDSKIDLDGLKILADGYDSRSDTFDWVFDRKTTIWEALKLIARAGRAAPVVNLTEFSMVRDQVRTVPVLSFSPDSMVRGSFRVDYDFQKPDDFDGIKILYLDHDTFKEESVDCLLFDDLGVNLQTIRIPGITNRDKAFREGLYMRGQQIFQREQAQFVTGLEGMIPAFGDLIVASHDAPKWGTSGIVESIEADGVTVNLSDSLDGITGNSMALRDKFGQIVGPFSVTKTPDNDFQVIATSAIDQTLLRFDEFGDPPAYFFGPSNDIHQELVVTSLSSGGSQTGSDETVSVTAINYDDRIFGFDTQIAPARGADSVPISEPDLPVLTGLAIISDISNLTVVQITWDVTLGARFYVLQRSLDGVNWDPEIVVNQTFTEITVTPGQLFVRVAGVNVGQGPFQEVNAFVGFSVRITSNGDTRVTSSGDRRITVGPTI